MNIREDREKLALACTSNALRVLFFDQLLDNLGVGTDDWRQKAVRDALQPLRSLARELEVAALGCLHPNKRGASFRELVAGAPAFNAASRSSLLLAEHPDDPDTRVLVRGKGNLSAAPNPIEFRIVEHRFEANGHTFKVPLATGFRADGSLGIDDLLGDDSKREARTNVGEACEIIEALLPRDGEWHPARTLRDACEENSIDERTAQRAAEKLRLDKGRTKTFPACAIWRWPSSRDTDTSRENGVASVASVGTANARNPLWSSRDDTHDTPDSENKRHVRVVAEESAPEDRSAVVSVERFVECSNPDGHRAEHHRAHPSGEGVVCWLCHPPARATA